jgi:hypothetical protein
MTKEEILSSVISKAKFLNKRWLVSIVYNNNEYYVSFYGDGTETDSYIQQQVYRELLGTTLTQPTPEVAVDRGTLVNSTPIEKIAK